MDLTWFQSRYALPVMGKAQHRDKEYVIETSNRNHIGIVTELCIEIAVLLNVTYTCTVFSAYFYHTAKSKILCNITCHK